MHPETWESIYAQIRYYYCHNFYFLYSPWIQPLFLAFLYQTFIFHNMRKPIFNCSICFYSEKKLELNFWNLFFLYCAMYISASYNHIFLTAWRQRSRRAHSLLKKGGVYKPLITQLILSSILYLFSCSFQVPWSIWRHCFSFPNPPHNKMVPNCVTIDEPRIFWGRFGSCLIPRSSDKISKLEHS